MILAPVVYRVVTPHGQGIVPVFTALQQKKIAASILPYCLSAGSRRGSLVPVQMGVVPTITATKPVDRTIALLKSTLSPLLHQVLSSSKSADGLECTQIMLVIPAKSSVRYSYCSQEIVQNFIDDDLNAGKIPSLAQYWSITFIHEDEDLISPFLQAQTALHQGDCKRLIFGGVDSFLTVKAIRDFEAKHSVRKEGNPDAPLLGEGAAFICLSNQANLLGKAIDIDNSPSNMPPSSYWITNRGLSLRAEFDWYEFMKNYPNFRNLRELNLQKWIGHLGAVQFPLQVLLGFYWAKIQAKNAMRTEPIVLYNEHISKQLIFQKYRCFQHLMP